LCQQREVWIQLACALDRFGHFGNGSAIGKVARSKGVGYGSISLYTKRVIAALKELAPKYITWPGPEERRHLSEYNHKEYGFDGCILSSDGTHIVLFQRPSLEGEVYFNRKSSYSLNVMLTFDHRRNIRYLNAGWPGSVHDSRIWESGLAAKDPARFFSNGQYQFGDSGFALSKQMIVPYRQPAASIPENEEFNLRLSRGRVVSEHGNGILKGRFQSLRCLPVCIAKASDVEFACDWIIACCVLHNMVNSRRRVNDEVAPFEEAHDRDSADPATMAATSTTREASQWRKQIQEKVLHFWS
jgi:hypothetical protein